MKNTIILNQAPHGIGPILRTAEMAQDLYHMLKAGGKETVLLITEPEKPFIKNILMNETYANDEFLDSVWVSPEYGAIVNAFDYSSSDYVDRLENIAANRQNLEQRLGQVLSQGMDAYRLVNPEEERTFTYDDILCEINHNPIVRTNFNRSHPSFYTTIGLFSEILKNAKDVNPSYLNPELQRLVKACIHEANVVEDGQTLLMIAEPSAMTYRGDKILQSRFRDIPPFIRPPEGNTDILKDGIYLNISGIDSVKKQIVSLAQPFIDAGFAVYYPPSYEEGIENGTKMSPVNNGVSIFSNPAIIAAVGRMGWSSVWEPMMNGNPFITYEYSQEEDPEMHHNVRTLEEKGLGLVMKLGDNPKDIMEKALNLKSGIIDYVKELKQRYGTLNGIAFAANLTFEELRK